MEFNPVQTNQRPAREKLAQRIWEMLRPIIFGCSPWFARKWRVMWVKFAALWYRGGKRNFKKLLNFSQVTCGLSMEFKNW